MADSHLVAIEDHVRDREVVDLDADLVIRGWPLNVQGVLRAADATRRRYAVGGEPMTAVSAEVTVAGWGLDRILAGDRMRTRRSYASAPAGRVTAAGFRLLATFAVPHYSVILPSYSEESAHALLAVLGQVQPNPHFVRRQSD